jgi:hypothetical protein
VTIRERDGHAPQHLELPPGGYVLLYGEDLVEGLGSAHGGPDLLLEVPKPHYLMQLMPSCCVSVDEFTCIGGGALLQLRYLAMALAYDHKPFAVEHALRAWARHRPNDHGQIDLAAVADTEWKQMNLSFAYELPLYAAVLTPALMAVPAVDDAYPDARRVLDMLAPFHRLPLEYVPATSPTRAFCGGAWL